MAEKFKVIGLEIQRIAREHVDRRADAAFLEVRSARLVDDDLADDLRRHHEVVERARGCELLEHEPVGGCNRMPVQQRLA